MFDRGIYLADASSKSVAYSRAPPGGSSLLLLCEAELGQHKYKAPAFGDANAAANAAADNAISTWGEGLTRPTAWASAAVVGLPNAVMVRRRTFSRHQK